MVMVSESLRSFLPAPSAFGNVRFIAVMDLNCMVTNDVKTSMTSTSINGTRLISGFFRRRE